MSDITGKDNPDLEDLLSLMKRDTMLSTNCHAIGKVNKFNASNQTSEIEVVYSKRYSRANSQGVIESVEEQYPLLVDVPTVQMYGGDGGLCLPIKTGDYCILMFNDRNIDNWFSGKDTGFVKTPRVHSLSDGIALVGLRSKNNFDDHYEDEKVILFYKNTILSLGDKIKLENEVHNLKDLVSELITTIKGITTTGSASAQAVSGASQAALDAVAVKFEGLLE